MNFLKKAKHIRPLILFFIIGAAAINLSAQTVSQIIGEAKEPGSANVEVETKNKDKAGKDKMPDEKTERDNTVKEEKAMKQADPKPPRFGGHVGIVIPIVTRGDGRTVSIADDFIIGFPAALVVKTDSPVAFDFEFVPTINTPSNQDFRFLIHPGIVYAFKKNYLVGVRAAYEVGTGNYGFTPIAQRSFKLTKKTRYFVEADFPVRWEKRPNNSRFTSFQFAIHSGISF
jgi:hypothetical protein